VCAYKHEFDDNEGTDDNAMNKRKDGMKDWPLKFIYGILLLFVRDANLRRG
jgi:hypothetical protein